MKRILKIFTGLLAMVFLFLSCEKSEMDEIDFLLTESDAELYTISEAHIRDLPQALQNYLEARSGGLDKAKNGGFHCKIDSRTPKCTTTDSFFKIIRSLFAGKKSIHHILSRLQRLAYELNEIRRISYN